MRHTWLAPLAALGSLTLLLSVTGCAHRARVAYAPPPPAATYPQVSQYPEQGAEPNTEQGTEQAPQGQPLFSEVGIASWYGPPYNRRQGANGEIYNENDVSAAHRTLPMGTLIRVTDLENGRSAMMRITDRGPFVPGRILDVSEGAAKLLGMWRAGIARVRIDVYQMPESPNGGRWCVQIGAFQHARAARKLQHKLQREFEQANVIEFKGPTGHWVRIRPVDGNKRQAVWIAQNVRPREGAAYLVRLN